MQTYHYKAVNQDGTTEEGKRIAQNRDNLIGLLEERGWTPVKVERQSSFWRHPIHHKDYLARFFRNLHLFLESGMELLPALSLVQKRIEDNELQACVGTIIDDLKRGQSFGNALQSCEPYFPPSAHRISAVAEETGELPRATEELADFFRSQHEFLNNVYSMILYPFIVLVVGLGVAFFLFTVVVPRLQTIVPEGQSLPLISQIVFGIGNFMEGPGFWGVILGLVMLPFVLYTGYRSRSGQRIVTWFLNRNRLYRTIKSQLFCLSLGMCTRVGMDITRALQLGRDVMGNETLKNQMDEVIEQVRQGHSLTESLADQGFTEIPLDSLKAGEESGNLDEVFQYQAELLDEDVNRRLNRLITMIEPMIILVMALFVGIILVAVLLPIFSLSASL